VLRAGSSDPAATEDLVRRTGTEFGRIDAIIKCSGSYHRAALLEERV
jgi:NAD(P)-dependent dehydrogenase (short-subunit alcohol dehydrogenase family)